MLQIPSAWTLFLCARCGDTWRLTHGGGGYRFWKRQPFDGTVKSLAKVSKNIEQNVTISVAAVEGMSL